MQGSLLRLMPYEYSSEYPSFGFDFIALKFPKESGTDPLDYYLQYITLVGLEVKRALKECFHWNNFLVAEDKQDYVDLLLPMWALSQSIYFFQDQEILKIVNIANL
jgi:hypothetical protein